MQLYITCVLLVGTPGATVHTCVLRVGTPGATVHTCVLRVGTPGATVHNVCTTGGDTRCVLPLIIYGFTHTCTCVGQCVTYTPYLLKSVTGKTICNDVYTQAHRVS